MQERETPVGVLDKAMTILLVFSREERMLTPREMAARTHLSLPTVYRLAQALSTHGLLEQDGHHFRLGMELLRLGSLAAEANDLRRVALPHMHWLNARTGESIELHGRQPLVLTQKKVEGKLEEVDPPQRGKRPCKRHSELLRRNLRWKRSNLRNRVRSR